jgi:hypothetical protein
MFISVLTLPLLGIACDNTVIPIFSTQKWSRSVGFHLQTEIQTCIPEQYKLISIYQKVPKEAYIDRHQIVELIQSHLNLNLIDLWMSQIPDIEVPAIIAQPFEFILTLKPLSSCLHIPIAFHSRYLNPHDDLGYTNLTINSAYIYGIDKEESEMSMIINLVLETGRLERNRPILETNIPVGNINDYHIVYWGIVSSTWITCIYLIILTFT